MPPTPDFDQLARRVVDETGVGRLDEWDADDPDRVVRAIAEQLRLVWNARGAADLAKIETELSTLMGGMMAGPYVKNLDRVLRSLDR